MATTRRPFILPAVTNVPSFQNNNTTHPTQNSINQPPNIHTILGTSIYEKDFTLSGRHKFTPKEDEQLKCLVEKYGENWKLISSQMTERNRTPRQCRERYKNYLSPSIHNSPWTTQEEDLLRQRVKEFGPKWVKIALSFDARSEANVKNHWAFMQSRELRFNEAKKKANDMNIDENNIPLSDSFNSSIEDQSEEFY